MLYNELEKEHYFVMRLFMQGIITEEVMELS